MRRRPRAAPLVILVACGLAAVANARQELRSSRGQAAPAAKAAPAQTPAPTPAARAAQMGEEEVLRVDTTLVAVPVSVLDSSGRYVPDLRREDFRVFEDGVEQEIAYFAPAEKPFTVALLLDTSDSLRFRLQDLQAAAVAFVEQLRPEDQVMVVSFSSRVEILCEPTSDREALRRAIRRAYTQGGTRVYDVVDFVVRERLERIAGDRKALILFTDGIDTGSFHSTRESTLLHMEESDVLAYAVQYTADADAGAPLRDAVPSAGGPSTVLMRGAGADQASAARASTYLRELSRRTGARHYRPENLQSLGRAFAHVAAELRRQYSLGYYPKEPARGAGRRRIKVTVNRPKLTVRARAGYVSPAPATGAPVRT